MHTIRAIMFDVSVTLNLLKSRVSGINNYKDAVKSNMTILSSYI